MDQYIRLRNILQDDRKYKEFASRLSRSHIHQDPYYLGLLLLNLLHSNKDDIHQYLSLFKKYMDINDRYGFNPNFQQPNGFIGSKDTQRSILMIACEKSNRISVEAILQCEGLNIQTQDSQGRNAMFYALMNQIENNSCQILDLLIVRNFSLLNSVDSDGKSLLFYAISRKSLKIIEKLLSWKVNPNIQAKNTGNTILHDIILRGKGFEKKGENQKQLFFVKETVKLLLQFGCNPYLKNKDQENCFSLCKNNYLDIQNIIKSHLSFENKENINSEKSNSYNYNNYIKEVEDDLSSDSGSSNEEDINTSQELSNEIYEYYLSCDKVYQEAWEDIQPIYCGVLFEMSQTFNLQINIIGSFATGLWTPYSDINIMYTNTDPKVHVDIDSTLQKMQKVLKGKSKILSISKVYVKRSPKFPKLKVEINVKGNNRKLDISIFHRNTASCKYVCFITEELNKNMPLRPLFFFFHELLRNWKMNSLQKGGLQNYILFLMLWMVNDEIKPDSYENIGQLFGLMLKKMIFLMQCEQKLEDGESKKVLNIRDPLNPLNCLGSWQTNADKLEQILKALYYGINAYKGKNILSYLCNLSKIFN